jgi:quercetin dioxygenase-like cupin family protein
MTRRLSRVAQRWALPMMMGAVIGAGGMYVHMSEAQPQPIKRIPLTKVDLTGVEGKEVLLTVFEAQSGALFPAHTHPGDEFVYLLFSRVNESGLVSAGQKS